MDDFVPTRVSKVKGDAVKDFVSINYEAPKKKSKQSVSETNLKTVTRRYANSAEKDADLRRKQEVEMKRVRYEIMKFGMSGFEKIKAQKAKVALAISLGAKPPKNRSMNYVALKDLRKKEKESKKTEVHTSGFKSSMRKYKTKKTRKDRSGGILGVYGKVDKNVKSRNKR